MMSKNNNKREYILEYDMCYISFLSIILLVFMILLTIFFLYILPPSLIGILKEKLTLITMDNHFLFTYLIFFIIMILWMVLHEIIHSMAYQIKGAKKENIVFGIALEKGVFYCKCKEYINKECIMTSLLSPFLLIGVMTYILGFIIQSPLLIILSIINISGAAGDLTIFNFFIKQNKDIEFKELGFSSPFCLKTTDNLKGKKFIGIKTIKEVDRKETIEGPEKKLTITKESWKYIIVLISIILIYSLLICL